MSTASNTLDKLFHTEAAGYGKIAVRVVVLPPKPAKDDAAEEAAVLEDEDSGKAEKASPLKSYLENPKGKQCVVFLINGQRHHGWDNQFVSRDLGFKYLRTRTMVIVDLDGLTPIALAEIIRGSRQSLLEGKVYYAIRDRLVSMLKKDDDLDALQKQAEQKMLEMDSGDEAVKNKLDQLIDGYHTAGDADGAGEGEAGPHSGEAPHFATSNSPHGVVVMGSPTKGEAANLPVLVTNPRLVAARLLPGQQDDVIVTSNPRPEWANLQEFTARLDPAVEGLTLDATCGDGHSRLTLLFTEPDEFDEEEYPIKTDLLAFARFQGHADTRMLKLPVVVGRPKDDGGEGGKKKKKRVLRADPTYLKVVSRQPVKLIPGGPSTHVKLRWDGQDTLLFGSPPDWTFQARCVSLGTFPKIGFGIRGEGRLELLLDTPRGLLTRNPLDFEVVAIGPKGQQLTATFKAELVDQVTNSEPRKVTAQSPDTAAQRRPPYKLAYVNKNQWGERGWDDGGWTGEDAGCFQPPTEAAPLIIVLNKDMSLLKDYRDELVARKLDVGNINDRMGRYYSHVGFHLWQMYGQYRRREDANALDPSITVPSPEDLREQINLVGVTLIRMMEVSR